MLRKFLAIGFVIISITALAQKNPVAFNYAERITSENLKGYLSILASDAMEGRETGKRGQKMAAAFIAATFEEMGLQGPVSGSYYQPVPLFSMSALLVTLKAETNEVSSDNYVFFGSGQSNGEVALPLVFVGNGSDAELEKLDITGKSVMVLLEPNASIMNNTVIAKLREKGAKLLLVVIERKEEFSRIAGMVKRFSGGQLSLKRPDAGEMTGSFILPSETAGKIFNTTFEKLKQATEGKKISKIKPTTISYSITQAGSEVRSENILGFLEGTDKKDELVVITAHYDHIGISTRGGNDKINNGADDDGSGTVTVLELAKAFVEAKKEGNGPRRSILFMTVTGEEKGLLGSQYYTEHPVFPLNNTVVDLNIDMIGRSDAEHKTSAPYVYVIGSDKLSSELHALSEATNKANYNLIFDYVYNDQNHPDRLYYRSDHWNFAKKNIPIIFYFDGIHEDYHKASDEIDKIEFDLLTLRAKTIFLTAWEIANRDGRVAVDKK